MFFLPKSVKNANGQLDDLKILRTWAEYSSDRSTTEYLMYELEMEDESGNVVHYYKAVKLLRIIRLPKSAKQSESFMDMQTQVLAALWERKINLITIFANILRPVPLGLLFLYGVQCTSTSEEEAKQKVHKDYLALMGILQGTFRVLEFKTLTYQELEWLREKMFSMKNMTVVRGIPKAKAGGTDSTKQGMGGTNINPDAQDTTEEFIAGMSGKEYIVQVLSSPVKAEHLERWLGQTAQEITKWNKQLQGTTTLTAGVSLPMQYMGNLGASQGWSHSYNESETTSTTLSESMQSSFNTSVGESVSQSFGETIGRSFGETMSDNVGDNYTSGMGTSDGTSWGSGIGSTQGTSSSFTESLSNGSSYGEGTSSSTTHTDGTSLNISQTESESISNSTGVSQSTSDSVSSTDSTSNSTTVTGSTGSSHTDTTSSGTTNSKGHSTSESTTESAGMTSSKTESHTDTSTKSESDSTTHSTSTSVGGGISTTVGVNSSTSVSVGANVSYMGIGGSIDNTTTVSSNTSVSTSTNINASSSHGVTSGTSHSESTSSGFSDSTSNSVNVSNTQSQSHSDNTSVTQSNSNSFGTSSSHSEGKGQGSSQSTSTSHSLSSGSSDSSSSSFGTSTSKSDGIGSSDSTSNGKGENWQQSVNESESKSYGKNNSVSQNSSVGGSSGVSANESWGLSRGQSYGQNTTDSYSSGATTSTGRNYSESNGLSQGQSWSRSDSASRGQAFAMTGGLSTATSSTMGLGPSISYGKTYQWMDQEVKNILMLLEFQNLRIMTALKGNGAFFTDVYIATPDKKTQQAAAILAKSAWQNEDAMVCPLQVLNISEEEQRHLLYHFSAFSPDNTKEGIPGHIESYRYSTILLPGEFTALTHLPRISDGGVFADVNDVPKFAVPSLRKGDIYMGKILSGERWTPRNGYETRFDYRLDESELMHGIFTGESRSGKTVAATRFVVELTKLRRRKTGKRLRIVALDPKQDWRILAKFVEPERFHFYSLGNPEFLPINLNICKVPKNVNPQVWVDGIIEIYCRCYNLLERGKALLGESFYALYNEAGVFEDSPNWRDFVPERSGKVTLCKVYERMMQIKVDLEDPAKSGKGRMGNEARDVYARVLDRLQVFGRKFSIESRLFGQPDGIAVDELIGQDDIIVLESYGLETTFKNFVFGCITSGFFKYAQGHEGGFLAPDQYETVLIIEEANEVLTGSDTAGAGGAMPSLGGQSEFEKILDQAAGLGLFIIAITQKIADMPSSCVANSGLIFAGKISRVDDVTLVIRKIGREERYDDRDILKWFPRSPIGWFVCRSSRNFDFKESEPVLVHIDPLGVDPPTNKELLSIVAEKKMLEYLNS